MTYPVLDQRSVVTIVPGPGDVATLPADVRQAVMVVMTSASRGCSADMIEALPNLGFVVSQGVGRDKIDTEALASRGIRLRCVGEAVIDDVADLAITLTHVLCRNLLGADAFARSGDWSSRRFGVTDSAVGMIMGIAGLSGRIGQAIARRAEASKMQIAGLDRPSNRELGVSLYADIVALAEASDVLVLAVPGTADLRHMIGRRELEALGPKGRLINVGRGSLVDTQALIEALEQGTIAGAALDVLEEEPNVPPRLAALSNVVLTPHVGAQTWGQRARGAKIAEDEVLNYLEEIAKGQ